MSKILQNERGMADILLIVVLVAVIAVGGYVFYVNRQANSKKAAEDTTVVVAKKTTTPVAPVDQYAGWKVYTSKTEKATFKYPTDWTLATSEGAAPGSDVATVKSPSGAITLTWTSLLSGLGGGCDMAPSSATGGCPDITVVSHSSIAGASGLEVAAVEVGSAGTIQPCVAVIDSTDAWLKGPSRGMAYTEFTSRNNGTLLPSGKAGQSAFSSGGFYCAGPKLTKAGADAWFNSAEAKQAKLILASLTY